MWRLNQTKNRLGIVKRGGISLKQGGILVKLLCVMIVAFIVIQLSVLTTVGTQGEKISDIRKQQAEIKIQNEIARAKILELQSNPRIQETVSQKLQLQPVHTVYLDPENRLISAQDR